MIKYAKKKSHPKVYGAARKLVPALSDESGEGPGNQELSHNTELYYMPGRWYSFTVCPAEQSESSSNRWEITSNRIYECVLSAFGGCAHYRYNLEISEPHDTIGFGRVPRIHAHGRFSMPNERCVRDFLLFGLYNLTQLGVIEIDTCQDLSTWDAYCKKQVSITRFKTVKCRLEDGREMKPYDEPKHPVKSNSWDTWKPPAS